MSGKSSASKPIQQQYTTTTNTTTNNNNSNSKSTNSNKNKKSWEDELADLELSDTLDDESSEKGPKPISKSNTYTSSLSPNKNTSNSNSNSNTRQLAGKSGKNSDLFVSNKPYTIDEDSDEEIISNKSGHNSDPYESESDDDFNFKSRIKQSSLSPTRSSTLSTSKPFATDTHGHNSDQGLKNRPSDRHHTEQLYSHTASKTPQNKSFSMIDASSSSSSSSSPSYTHTNTITEHHTTSATTLPLTATSIPQSSVRSPINAAKPEKSVLLVETDEEIDRRKSLDNIMQRWQINNNTTTNTNNTQNNGSSNNSQYNSNPISTAPSPVRVMTAEVEDYDEDVYDDDEFETSAKHMNNNNTTNATSPSCPTTTAAATLTPQPVNRYSSGDTSDVIDIGDTDLIQPDLPVYRPPYSNSRDDIDDDDGGREEVSKLERKISVESYEDESYEDDTNPSPRYAPTTHHEQDASDIYERSTSHTNQPYKYREHEVDAYFDTVPPVNDKGDIEGYVEIDLPQYRPPTSSHLSDDDISSGGGGGSMASKDKEYKQLEKDDDGEDEIYMAATDDANEVEEMGERQSLHSSQRSNIGILNSDNRLPVAEDLIQPILASSTTATAEYVAIDLPQYDPSSSAWSPPRQGVRAESTTAADSEHRAPTLVIDSEVKEEKVESTTSTAYHAAESQNYDRSTLLHLLGPSSLVSSIPAPAAPASSTSGHGTYSHPSSGAPSPQRAPQYPSYPEPSPMRTASSTVSTDTTLHQLPTAVVSGGTGEGSVLRQGQVNSSRSTGAGVGIAETVQASSPSPGSTARLRAEVYVATDSYRTTQAPSALPPRTDTALLPSTTTATAAASATNSSPYKTSQPLQTASPTRQPSLSATSRASTRQEIDETLNKLSKKWSSTLPLSIPTPADIHAHALRLTNMSTFPFKAAPVLPTSGDERRSLESKSGVSHSPARRKGQLNLLHKRIETKRDLPASASPPITPSKSRRATLATAHTTGGLNTSGPTPMKKTITPSRLPRSASKPVSSSPTRDRDTTATSLRSPSGVDRGSYDEGDDIIIRPKQSFEEPAVQVRIMHTLPYSYIPCFIHNIHICIYNTRHVLHIHEYILMYQYVLIIYLTYKISYTLCTYIHIYIHTYIHVRMYAYIRIQSRESSQYQEDLTRQIEERLLRAYTIKEESYKHEINLLKTRLYDIETYNYNKDKQSILDPNNSNNNTLHSIDVSNIEGENTLAINKSTSSYIKSFIPLPIDPTATTPPTTTAPTTTTGNIATTRAAATATTTTAGAGVSTATGVGAYITVSKPEYNRLIIECENQERLLLGYQSENNKLINEIKLLKDNIKEIKTTYYDQRLQLNTQLNQYRQEHHILPSSSTSAFPPSSSAFPTTSSTSQLEGSLPVVTKPKHTIDSNVLQRELEQDALIRVLKERLAVSEAGGGGREKELQGTIDKLRNGRYMCNVSCLSYVVYAVYISCTSILYSNNTVYILYFPSVCYSYTYLYLIQFIYYLYYLYHIYTENIEMTTTISRLHQQIQQDSHTSKNQQSAEKTVFLSEISDLKKKLSWYIDNQILIDTIQTEKEYYKNIIKILKNELIIHGISRDNIYKLISTIPSASVQNSSGGGKKGQNYDPSGEDDDVRDTSINTTSVSTTHVKDKHSSSTSSTGNIRKRTAVTGAARPQDTKRIRYILL